MSNRAHYTLLGCVGFILFALGCGGTNPTPSTSQPTATHEDHSGHDHASEDHGGEAAIEKALASLSAEDRAAAEKQQTCPVSGEPLGSMAAPIKLTVEGRDVFVCCDGCTDALMAEPGKFLAKLPQD